MIFLFFLLDNLFTTISTLNLNPSLLLDKKRFMCDVRHETLTDNLNLLRTYFEVQILSPPTTPKIYDYSSSVYLTNGTLLNLSCLSEGGEVSWYRSDIEQSLSNETNISITIQPSDNNAILSCFATNEYLNSLRKTLKTNITLQVACK